MLLEICPEADLAHQLPPTDHPLYLAVLGELIRIDLERAWANGRRKRVTDYASPVPGRATLRCSRRSRSRSTGSGFYAGVPMRDPDEYRHRFGVDTSEWGEFGPESAGTPTLQKRTRAGFEATHGSVRWSARHAPTKGARTASRCRRSPDTDNGARYKGPSGPRTGADGGGRGFVPPGNRGGAPAEVGTSSSSGSIWSSELGSWSCSAASTWGGRVISQAGS